MVGGWWVCGVGVVVVVVVGGFGGGGLVGWRGLVGGYWGVGGVGEGGLGFLLNLARMGWEFCWI